MWSVGLIRLIMVRTGSVEYGSYRQKDFLVCCSEPRQHERRRLDSAGAGCGYANMAQDSPCRTFVALDPPMDWGTPSSTPRVSQGFTGVMGTEGPTINIEDSAPMFIACSMDNASRLWP